MAEFRPRQRAIGLIFLASSGTPDPPIPSLEVRLEEVNGDEGKPVGTTAEAMPQE